MAPQEPRWPDGFLIRPRVEGLPPELVAAYGGVATAHVSDCLGRCVGAVGLLPFHGDKGLAGNALTVRVRPGDNLMIHKAVRMAAPGDVIVIDAAGDVTQAVIGGLMREVALKRGIGGFVVDGAIRDVAEFRDGALPCYARAVNHRGPTKEGPGEINVPISCAGMAVAPGDLIVGDADGVVAVPASQAAALLERVRAHAAKEEAMRAGFRAGTPDDQRFDDILRAKGVPAALLRP